MASNLEFDLGGEENQIRQKLNTWFKQQPRGWQAQQIKKHGDYWKWADSEIKKWAQGKRSLGLVRQAAVTQSR